MEWKDLIQGKPLGYPTHPLFVHFPSALYPTSLLLDILSWLVDESALVKAAFYDIAIGTALGLLAAVTGFVDYFGMIPGFRKHVVATWHWVLQVSVLAVFAVSLALRWPLLEAPRTPPGLVALSIAAVIPLLVGSYLGGELVYRMGMRVSTGPRPTPPLLALLDAILTRIRRLSPRPEATAQAPKLE